MLQINKIYFDYKSEGILMGMPTIIVEVCKDGKMEIEGFINIINSYVSSFVSIIGNNNDPYEFKETLTSIINYFNNKIMLTNKPYYVSISTNGIYDISKLNTYNFIIHDLKPNIELFLKPKEQQKILEKNIYKLSIKDSLLLTIENKETYKQIKDIVVKNRFFVWTNCFIVSKNKEIIKEMIKDKLPIRIQAPL